jgi:hypothetical protein
MFEKFIYEIREFLPLKITLAEWNDPLLTILGYNWNFNTMTEWRVCDNSKVIKACYDDESSNFIRNLNGLNIIKVNCQSGPPVIDPVFEFSNGLFLQIFSTSAIEPWKFQLPNNKMFIASPTDEKWGISYTV